MWPFLHPFYSPGDSPEQFFFVLPKCSFSVTYKKITIFGPQPPLEPRSRSWQPPTILPYKYQTPKSGPIFSPSKTAPMWPFLHPFYSPGDSPEQFFFVLPKCSFSVTYKKITIFGPQPPPWSPDPGPGSRRLSYTIKTKRRKSAEFFRGQQQLLCAVFWFTFTPLVDLQMGNFCFSPKIAFL